MRELNIEQRLIRIEENIAVIKQMLEKLLNKPVTSLPDEDGNEIMSVKQVAQFLGLPSSKKGSIKIFSNVLRCIRISFDTTVLGMKSNI